MATEDTKIQPRQFTKNLLEFRYREVTMVVATGLVLIASVVLFPGFENVTAGVNSEVGTVTLAFFFLVAIFAGAVKGALGFGYALITTPVFATVIDPTLAVVVLAIPPWMINVFQVGETKTGLTYIKREWSLITLALLGSIIGVFFLNSFQKGPLIPFLIAILLLGYVLFEVISNFVVIEEASNSVALGAVGLGEGFLLAAANLGPLLPAYLHTFERDTERYVGGLSMVFTVVFTERIIHMWFNGLLTPYRLWLGSAIGVITIVGLLFGTYLRRLEIDEKKFNWLVIVMLLVIALNIFRNTIPVLFL
ncbi:sulfite exporter TauE/SafE family protein [Natrinema gelatinilyticum]|uniref:sulfite exporter TauE/SafE family protein n=1 Tax=Natrinema gelatinilyticum TaxID=2961571 RepID=UPI0020C28B26|nr:sulfite exporter TauE/SafE family protein [Natrinema gelatinilyticum]